MNDRLSLIVTPAVRRRLKAVAGNRNSPQKHVWRAKIVLLSAEGAGTVEIMRQMPALRPMKSRTTSG
jgi:hypothetical protein